MKGRKLQDAARDVAEQLPAATRGHPFGPEYEVFKVKGKVFMLLTEVPGDPIVVLKAEPDGGITEGGRVSRLVTRRHRIG